MTEIPSADGETTSLDDKIPSAKGKTASKNVGVASSSAYVRVHLRMEPYPQMTQRSADETRDENGVTPLLFATPHGCRGGELP
jgi:hypothetical protein